jgi:hypothetical protein
MELEHKEHRVAPICRLPDDVVADFLEMGQSLFDPGFGLIVSHVSQQWRRVAVNLPILWSNVIRITSSQSLDKLETYLTRSQQRPVDTTPPRVSHMLADESLASGLVALIAHAGRWHSITSIVAGSHSPLHQMATSFCSLF